MSTTTDNAEPVVEVPPPSHFAARADGGDETWLEDTIVAYLDLRLGPKQRSICRSVVNNERTAVIGANGTGKTYITAAIVLAWQTVRYPAISFGTSGTGKKLYRTLCRPIDKLHGAAVGGAGLPGEFKRQPPRIDYDDPEHYFEAATPTDAGELEGAHSAYTLAIIEEADKDDVTAETVDAMRSLIPDYDTSRMLAVGNPPESESNVFHTITQPDSAWNVVRISSFDSHNVRVETGDRKGEIIDGMATVSALREDWLDYHEEDWPGVAQAEVWSDPDHPDFRDDLDERWYRRRAGVMPPSGASAHRPIYLADVEAAWNRTPSKISETPDALGLDVARAGDRTALGGPHGDAMRVHYAEQGTDHRAQESTIRDHLDDWPPVSVAVDAVGEGSGLADRLQDATPGVVRYKAGSTARDATQYDDCWTEGLALLGRWLRDGGAIEDRRLREELAVAARTIEYDTKFLASRGRDGAEVLTATSKAAVKDRLGRSPDLLDMAMMAIWARDTSPQKTVRRRSGSSPTKGNLR